MHLELEGFIKGLQEKIQRQLEDIVQMNIVTATAVSEDILGHIPPEVESQVSFVEAGHDQAIAVKMPGGYDNNRNNSTREYIRKTDKDLYATVLVRTIIELDGDITMLLRSQKADSAERQIVALDKDILAAHQANVIVALENWHFFVQTALDTLKDLVDLANLGK